YSPRIDLVAVKPSLGVDVECDVLGVQAVEINRQLCDGLVGAGRISRDLSQSRGVVAEVVCEAGLAIEQFQSKFLGLGIDVLNRLVLAAEPVSAQRLRR